MNDRSVTHATFNLARLLKAAPDRVWLAYADPQKKREWFAATEAAVTQAYHLDFREGGSELWRGSFNGMKVEMQAQFVDLVPDQRIVTAYQMHIDGKRISVSVQTVELRADPAGCALKLTEYGAYLDGYDNEESRRKGTEDLLDALASAVED
jgi:uncharacterized protein YndB with AHSA1/START domain